MNKKQKDAYKWAKSLNDDSENTKQIKLLLEIIDRNRLVGNIEEANAAYKRKTSVVPIAHHYEKEGEQPYVKYSCPVCSMLENEHQVSKLEERCPLCGVNLHWEI